MLRFKHFSGVGVDLERAINEWLDTFEPEVSEMTQTVSSNGNLSICFLFEESFRGQERRLAEESGMGSATNPSIPRDALQDEPLTVSADSAVPVSDLP